MVKLRLRRRGRKKHPFYDIVAIDGRARRDGASLERVGYFDPMTTPKKIVLDAGRAIYWLNVGAQPTDVVRNILSREGVLLRRSLEHKGKDAAEIDAQVEAHKNVAEERFERLKQRRKDRTIARAKAADDAQAAELEEAAKAEKAAADAKAAEEKAAADAKAAEEKAAADKAAADAPAADAPAEEASDSAE